LKKLGDHTALHVEQVTTACLKLIAHEANVKRYLRGRMYIQGPLPCSIN